jgi:hypothetical protein
MVADVGTSEIHHNADNRWCGRRNVDFKYRLQTPRELSLRFSFILNLRHLNTV